ncbi:MAG: RluA family pseudouridine synthase [Fidelibacterota bacterium]
MTIHQFIVDRPDTRLDVFLSGNLPEISRAAIQNCIRRGLITVNGQLMKPSYRVQTGECVLVESLPEDRPVVLEPENIPLDILFEDDALVVINKPAGLTVHPGAGNRSHTLANALHFHFNALSDLNGAIRPGIVHRLDKDTSGVMVVAKTNSVHQDLALQFQERTVTKKYLGLTWGQWKEARGKIEGPIKRRRSDPTSFGVDVTGKPAATSFRILEALDIFSYLEFRPHTGRTHQIRVHAASRHHPIVGDTKYDGSIRRLQGYLTEVQLPLKKILKPLNRHFLHATELNFIHPLTGNQESFSAPLPGDLKGILDQIRQVVTRG